MTTKSSSAREPTSPIRHLSHRIWTSRLSLRTWLGIGIGATLIRCLVAVLLGTSPAPFAGDEETYAGLAIALQTPETFADWTRGFGLVLYPGTRAFILPAQALMTLGINPNLALRFTAIAYGLGVFVVFVTTTFRNFGSWPREDRRSIPLGSRQTAALLLLLSWPSLNAWTVVGLKDTTSMFWALLAIVSAATALGASRYPLVLGASTVLALSVIAIFQVRDYLFAPLLAAILVGVVLTLRSRSTWRRGRFLAILIVLVLLTAGALVGLKLSAPWPGNVAQLSNTQIGPGFDVSEVAPERPHSFTLPGPKALEALDEASKIRNNMAAGAETAIELPIVCPPSAGIRTRWCELVRLPLAVVYGAFIPLMGISAQQTDSPSYRAASVENYAWILLFLALVLVAARSRFHDRRLAVILIMFIAATLAGLSLFSGNSGTLFRQKAQVLAPALLVIAISTPRRGNQAPSQATDSDPTMIDLKPPDIH